MICYRCATPIPDDSRFCLSCGADVSGATSGERTQPLEVDAELLAKLQEDLGKDFTIQRELGRGGMAAVFLALETHLERPVAIKVLPPELTYGRGMIERFKREAKVAATLDHPHIIPIHRVSTGGKIFWYVMKYLEGESLADIIQRDAPLPIPQIADVLEQVAEALDYAHERGVIHRDVKPANVMIDAKGWATVTDFGIAKAATQSSMTGSGSMIGTPYYMSPEQCSGKKVTGASDQYSLGIMAFQMLTAHLPFTGDTVIEIVKKHCTDPIPPISVLRPGISPALVAVVERTLAKTPEERFSTTTDFGSAFAEAAEVERARGPRLTARTSAGPATKRPSVTADISPVPQQAPVPLGPRMRGRNRLPFALGGAALAIVAAVAVWRLNAPTPSDIGPGSQAAPPAPTATQLAATPGVMPDTAARVAADSRPQIPSAAAPKAAPRRLSERTSARRTAARTGSTPSVKPEPNDRPPAAAAASPAPAAAPATGTGSLFVWSNPPMPFSVAGRRYEANPTTVKDLPAGPVTIRFEASESTAAYEKTVQILSGQTVRPGRLVLPRKP